MQGKVVKGFVLILGGKVGTLFLGLVITPLLVRLLGSTQYGDYAYILSLLGITMILVNAGIFDGMRKYIAEDRDSSLWTEYVFSFYIRTAIFLAVLAALSYMTFSLLGYSKRILGVEFQVYFYLLSGLILSRQAYSLARAGLMGLGKENTSEPLRVVQRIAFGILALSLAYLDYGVVGVLMGEIIASILVSLLSFLFLSQIIDIKLIFSKIPSTFPKRELLAYNGYSILLILLTASLYHVDILLLKPMAGSQSTGYYRAALIIAEFLWFVPNTLQTVFLHSSSDLWSKGETKQITTLVSKATRYNLSLTLLLAIGLATLASDFVPLYFGAEFKAAVPPLLLLLPGTLGFALARPIFAVGQGKGKLRVLIVATGTSSLMNLVLNFSLIPRYGMAGAAIATSTSYGSMVVLHVWAARRIGFNPIDDIRLFRTAVVAALTFPVIFGSSRLIQSPIISLLVVPPIGFVVYATLSIKFGVISPNELTEINNRVPSSIGRVVNHFLEGE
jgi:O-antigen/teichoic acid export membrane protein